LSVAGRVPCDVVVLTLLQFLRCAEFEPASRTWTSATQAAITSEYIFTIAGAGRPLLWANWGLHHGRDCWPGSCL